MFSGLLWFYVGYYCNYREKSACAHLYNFTLKISKGKIGGSQLSLHIPDAGYELQGVCPLYLYGGEGHVNTGTHQPGIVT